jgi:hypothetical protein
MIDLSCLSHWPHMGRSPTFSRGIAAEWLFFVTRFTRQQNHHGRTMFRLKEQGKIMRLHLISGAVLVYTDCIGAICLAELVATPQNVPF